MRHLYVAVGQPSLFVSEIIAELGVEVISAHAMRELFSPIVRDDRGVLQYRENGEHRSLARNTFRAAALSHIRAGRTAALLVSNLTSAGDSISAALDSGYSVTVVDAFAMLPERAVIQCLVHSQTVDPMSEDDALRWWRSHRESMEKARRTTSLRVIPQAEDGDIPNLSRLVAEDHTIRPLDLTGFDRVVITSDTQSAADAFGQLVEDQRLLEDPRALFIHGGDLLDRGKDPVGTFRLALDLAATGRARFAEGNHSSYLRSLLNSQVGADTTSSTSISLACLRGSFRDPTIRKHLARLEPAFLLQVGPEGGREDIVITHGGLSPAVLDGIFRRDAQGLPRLDLRGVAADELIYGTNTAGDIARLRSGYSAGFIRALEHPEITQIMGHRNGTTFDSMIPADELPRLIPLEGRAEALNDPETGTGKGSLRCVSIDVATGARTFSEYVERG